MVNLGDEIQVQGALASLNGERVLNATTVSTIGTGRPLPGELGVSNRGLGGGGFGLQSAVLDDSISSRSASGLNNVGSIVRAWGRVTHVDPSGAFFYIDDGTGLSDGSGRTGVRVGCSNLPVPSQGAYVMIDGVSGTALLGGRTIRLLRPRAAADLSYAASLNYLSNPGFETGTLASWTSYGSVDPPHSGTWFGGITANKGSWFFGNAANYGTKSGGLYQRVAVPSGRLYQAKAWSRVYRGGNPADSCESRTGLDPTGGIDPDSGNVLWSEIDTQPADYSSEWKELHSPSALCSGGYVTVFLDVIQTSSAGWHINCFDDASVSTP